MRDKLTRLHFWTADKSCYVLTDNTRKAIKQMQGEYDNVSVATNQKQDVNFDDVQIIFGSVANIQILKTV